MPLDYYVSTYNGEWINIYEISVFDRKDDFKILAFTHKVGDVLPSTLWPETVFIVAKGSTI